MPDARVVPADGDPAEVAAARESIRLAFVAALQHLPARQRAVLILREVLRWQASEVAELLDTTVASVNSALQRARATLGRRDAATRRRCRPVDADQQALLARYVDAFERYDISSLVALLHEDAIMSMPPVRPLAAGARRDRPVVPRAGRRVQGLAPRARRRPTAAPAFGSYRADGTGGHTPWAIQVIEVSGEPDRRAPQLPRPEPVRLLRPARPARALGRSRRPRPVPDRATRAARPVPAKRPADVSSSRIARLRAAGGPARRPVRGRDDLGAPAASAPRRRRPGRGRPCHRLHLPARPYDVTAGQESSAAPLATARGRPRSRLLDLAEQGSGVPVQLLGGHQAVTHLDDDGDGNVDGASAGLHSQEWPDVAPSPTRSRPPRRVLRCHGGPLG